MVNSSLIMVNNWADSTDMRGWWLCERQLPSGVLNGNKLFINDQNWVDSTDMLGWWLCERQLPSGGFNSK